MGWKWLDNLFKNDEDIKKEHIEEFTKSDEFKKMLREEATVIIEQSKKEQQEKERKKKEQHKQKLKQATEKLAEVNEEMKESSEPFVNVLSIGFTAENGIEVKLDYNKAFIRYLNKAGIKANNDEEAIRLWLAHLNYDISEEIKAQDYLMNGVSDDEQPTMSYDELFETDKDDDEEPDTGWEQPTS